jgi:CBS-domain-containing membrane protein
MLTTVYTIGTDATLREAMQIMAQHMMGTLPAVDVERHVLGVVVLDDVLTQFMPQFLDRLRSLDFVQDYSFLEAGRKSLHIAEKAIQDIMRPPYYVSTDSGLMAAMVVMHKHRVTEVPVVNEQKQLVGLASYVRVGSLFLTDWLNHLSEKE